MKHNPLLLSERIRRVIDHDSVILLHIILTSAVAVQLLLGHESYSVPYVVGSCIVLAIFSALGLARYFNTFAINNKPTLYIVLYHIFFTIGFGLFAPKFSPYLIAWLVLIFITHFYHGIRGLSISLALVFVALLNQSFRVLPDSASGVDYLEFVLFQFLIFAAISVYLTETQKVNDQDRKLIVTSMDKAQLERQRLISLINSMGDGVISTDDTGKIKLYNAAALNILDTNSNLQDKNINEVMTIIDQSAKTVDIIAEANNKTMTSNDHLLVYPDGEKINLYLNISPIKLSFRQNTERGFIISFRDITREKSLEEERNEFISVVSHELRTPIAITEANISNAQFIAEKGQDFKAVIAALEAAHKQAVFLANMINDLSTLSRAERGMLQMKFEPVNPKEIMKSLDEDYRKETETKGLALEIEIDESTPEEIMSNRLYIREILQNFVTNSIKYTREGGIKIYSVGRDDGVEFTVKDTGIGISKSDQKRVFDKFFRSEDFRTRESSGTGLGLYITKKLMKIIGAEFTLKSKLNEGSTFSVFVPNQKQDTNKES